MAMRNRLITISVVAIGLLIVSVPVRAHHGNAAIDIDKKTTLKGTVTGWIWSNPHCLLQVDVTDENGQVVHWVVETSNPPDMTTRGWSKNSFTLGDQVTVTAQPARSGKPVGRVVQVVLPNGQTLKM